MNIFFNWLSSETHPLLLEEKIQVEVRYWGSYPSKFLGMREKRVWEAFSKYSHLQYTWQPMEICSILWGLWGRRDEMPTIVPIAQTLSTISLVMARALGDGDAEWCPISSRLSCMPAPGLLTPENILMSEVQWWQLDIRMLAFGRKVNSKVVNRYEESICCVDAYSNSQGRGRW